MPRQLARLRLALALLGGTVLSAAALLPDAGAVVPAKNGKIAFESTRDYPTLPATDLTGWELYVMNTDGSGQTRLSNNNAVDFQPVFSPDGKKLLFYSSRDGDYEVYVMNADGSHTAQLMNNSETDAQPTWSPNGAARSSARSGTTPSTGRLDSTRSAGSRATTRCVV